MESKQVKIGLTLLGIREKQIKTIVRYHYLPTGLAKMKTSNNTKGWWLQETAIPGDFARNVCSCIALGFSGTGVVNCSWNFLELLSLRLCLGRQGRLLSPLTRWCWNRNSQSKGRSC